MAISESISAAMRALEDTCAVAHTFAKCLTETHVETDTGEANWVAMHQTTVDQLTNAADALIEALHRHRGT